MGQGAPSYTKDEIDKTFINRSQLDSLVTKTQLEDNKYATKDEISQLKPGNFGAEFAPYTKKESDDKFQTKGSYALSSDLQNYQPKGNYQPAGDYAVKAEVASTVATLAKIVDVYDKTKVYTKTETDSALSSYLTRVDASSTYLTKDGLRGPPGPTGVAGTMGPIGLTGPAGTMGSIGLTGTMGPIGLTGPAGTMGSIGLTGLTGVAGTMGPIGLTGPAGTMGPIGLTGPAGPSGIVNGKVTGGFSAPDAFATFHGVQANTKIHALGNITALGNVGVGTETPGHKLDVLGNGKFTGNVVVDGNITGGMGHFPKINVSGDATMNYAKFTNGFEVNGGTTVFNGDTKFNKLAYAQQGIDVSGGTSTFREKAFAQKGLEVNNGHAVFNEQAFAKKGLDVTGDANIGNFISAKYAKLSDGLEVNGGTTAFNGVTKFNKILEANAGLTVKGGFSAPEAMAGFHGVKANTNITALGNVGVGTETPGHKLDVLGNGKFTGNVLADGSGRFNSGFGPYRVRVGQSNSNCLKYDGSLGTCDNVTDHFMYDPVTGLFKRQSDGQCLDANTPDGNAYYANCNPANYYHRWSLTDKGQLKSIEHGQCYEALNTKGKGECNNNQANQRFAFINPK